MVRNRATVGVLVGLLGATTMVGVQIAASAPASAASTPQCTGVGSVYGVLSDGRLTYSAINATTWQRTKTLTSSYNLGFSPVAMATLNFNTILVTASGGELYRVDIGTNNTSLGVDAVTQIGTGWAGYENLTFDGHGHLFGNTTSGELIEHVISTAKPDSIPSGYIIGDSGWAGLNTLTAIADNQLVGTTSAGALNGYTITGTGTGDYNGAVLKSSTWGNMRTLTSPGRGVFYGQTNSGGMYGYLDSNPTGQSGSDIVGEGAIDTSGWTQTIVSADPVSINCDGNAQANAIVAAAQSEEGTPYCWAGGGLNGPSACGTDCSGLSMYAVYQGTGHAVALPHYSGDQYNNYAQYGGTRVARADLLPGDLVFFVGSDGTTAQPGHVGIYIGNNQMIDAQGTGVPVQVHTLYSDYVGAVRYWH